MKIKEIFAGIREMEPLELAKWSAAGIVLLFILLPVAYHIVVGLFVSSIMWFVVLVPVAIAFWLYDRFTTVKDTERDDAADQK